MDKKYFKFSWCVCSFDQECIIVATTEEKAKEIFQKEVVGEKDKTWAANHATVSNMSNVYKKEYLERNFKANFTE